MSSLIPHDYRYKISSPTPVDKEPFFLWNAYLITSTLRMYGRNTSGITMLPSACW